MRSSKSIYISDFQKISNAFFSWGLKESDCLEILMDAKWPSSSISSIICPNGHNGIIQALEAPNGGRYYCKSCRLIFSPLHGTFMSNSKCGLVPWFYCIYLAKYPNDLAKEKMLSPKRIADRLTLERSKWGENNRRFHRTTAYRLRSVLLQEVDTPLVKAIYRELVVRSVN